MELRKGSKGVDVRNLQLAINRHYGVSMLVADGIFGSLTDEVVRTIQKEHGLVVDGIVGPMTLDAINGSHASHIRPTSTVKCHGCNVKKSKRTIRYVAVHCSATPEGKEVSVDTIRRVHVNQRGWRDIGYHYIIHLDGSIELGRDVDQAGAHVENCNTYSVGICYIGGVDARNKCKDTRTPAQKEALRDLLRVMRSFYPTAVIKGHRDFSPDKNGNGIIEPSEWIKGCPCFDAMVEYKNI